MAINALGRRKAAVARVYFSEGKGNILINGKEANDYFPQEYLQYNIMDPLNISGVAGQYDIKVNVRGGGYKGQIEAIRMAFSRALVEIDADNRPALKQKKYLTRDSREVERKKFGKPKARKSFQFSKR